MLPYHEVRSRIWRDNHARNLRLHYFSARVSPYLTYLLVHTRITADQVTHLFTLLGVAAAVTIFAGGFWSVLAAVVLFRLHVLLDVVDGEVARFRGSSSRLAAYQDYLTHYVCYPLFLVGAGFNAYLGSGSAVALLAGALAAHAYGCLLASKDVWYRASFGAPEGAPIDSARLPASPPPSGAARRALRWIMETASFSGFLFFFLIATLADEALSELRTVGPGLRDLVLVAYAAGFYLQAGVRALLVRRDQRVPRKSLYL